MADRAPGVDAAQLIDRALAALAMQIAAGYRAWPARLQGARLFFLVEADGQVHARTVRFEADKPRLLSGIDAPPTAQTPFLSLSLDVPRLYALLTRPDGGDGVTAEGNAPDLLAEIARCVVDGAAR